MQADKKIDLRPLKKMALEKFPPSSVTKYLIESESDFINREEFAVKVGLWLKTLRWDLVFNKE
jgi:hypothetical protein